MPWSPQVVKTPQNQNRQSQRGQNAGNNKSQNAGNKQGNIHAQAQPLLAEEDSIPDSLLHPRWKIQRTMPVTYDDLNQSALDLKRPDGLKYEVTYNDSLNVYIIGTKMGSTYLATPIMMTPEEYMRALRSGTSGEDLRPRRCAHQDARISRTEIRRYIQEYRQPIAANPQPQDHHDGLRREDQPQRQR